MRGREGRAWGPEDLRLLADARMSSGPADREAAERDFGRLASGSASVVAVPRSVDDLQRILATANDRRLTLTPRGHGLSQGGQSLPAGGASLDLSHLARVEAPDPDARTLRCEAGATFRAVVEKAAPRGFLPSVMPLNPDLTVGGVLSVGGIGATSHTYGPVIAQVASLDVITGGGRRVTCSTEREPRVFEAVLGGVGSMGVIAAATLRLRPIKPKVRTFYCLYDALDPWLDDQRALVAAGRADYLEAFCTPSIQGFRNGPRGRGPFAEWFYACHVSVEHDGAPPDAATALAGLRPYRVLCHEDNDTVAYTDRYAPRFAAMRRSGAWTDSIHPWVEAFVPVRSLPALLPRVLDQVPLALQENPRLLFLARRNPSRFFRLPEDGEVAILAFTPGQVPPHLREDTLAAFRSIHADMAAAGAVRYLSGWLPMMDDAAWQAHFGDQRAAWRSLKAELDPHDVLGSVLVDAMRGR